MQHHVAIQLVLSSHVHLHAGKYLRTYCYVDTKQRATNLTRRDLAVRKIDCFFKSNRLGSPLSVVLGRPRILGLILASVKSFVLHVLIFIQ